MIPELSINPKIADYEKEIHRLQTIVDKWVYYRETHYGELYRGIDRPPDFYTVYIDLCFLKNELRKYKIFLLRKLMNGTHQYSTELSISRK